MVGQLNGRKSKKQAQDRFHPVAPFEHSKVQANKLKYQGTDDEGPPDSPNISDSPKPASSVSSETYNTLPKHVYSDSYDYHPDSKPPKDNYPSLTVDNYSPDSYDSKVKL